MTDTQPTNEPEFITRRRFLAGLAASVVAAGAPLPAGFPKPQRVQAVPVNWVAEWENVSPGIGKMRLYWVDNGNNLCRKSFERLVNLGGHGDEEPHEWTVSVDGKKYALLDSKGGSGVLPDGGVEPT